MVNIQPVNHSSKWWQWRVPLSPLLIWLMTFYPIWKWSEYWWLHQFLAIVLFGMMLWLTALLTVLSYTLLYRVRLRVPWPYVILAFAITTVLGMYAYHYSHAYGLRISEDFIKELDFM
jgi:hypothetical protein